jgi:hypothetical protein
MGLECGGYERQRIFVDQTLSRNKVFPTATIANTSRVSESSEIALPSTLARSAYENKYHGLFWEDYLPHGRAFTPEVAQFTTGKWIDAVHELFLAEPTLRMALLAMSLCSTGRRDGSKWMTEEGVRAYGRALHEMTRALELPTRAKSDGLLAAVRLLGIFEVKLPCCS